MGKYWNWDKLPWVGVTLGGCASVISALPTSAQTAALPPCSPPVAQEVLVLVSTPSVPLQEEVRLQVGRTLPRTHDLIVCQYGENIFSRVGGFASLAAATDWAEYFDEAVGLPSMVITPMGTEMVADSGAIAPEIPEVLVQTEAPVDPAALQGQFPPEQESPVATPTAAPDTASATTVIPFTPKLLGQTGYGILVDYGANPAILPQLQTLLDHSLALVAYGGRGYLLAKQVQQDKEIAPLLDQLNQNNFLAIAVPASQVVVLKENVTP